MPRRTPFFDAHVRHGDLSAMVPVPEQETHAHGARAAIHHDLAQRALGGRLPSRAVRHDHMRQLEDFGVIDLRASTPELTTITDVRLLASHPVWSPDGRGIVFERKGDNERAIVEYDEAIRLYEQLLREYPGQAKIWLSQGHALKTAGRQDESIAVVGVHGRILAAPRLWACSAQKLVRHDSRGNRQTPHLTN